MGCGGGSRSAYSKASAIHRGRQDRVASAGEAARPSWEADASHVGAVRGRVAGCVLVARRAGGTGDGRAGRGQLLPGPAGRRVDQAMANYHAAIQMDKEFAPAHAGLGLALFQAQRYAAAVEAMERALAIESELPDAGSLLLFIGRSWKELGDPLATLQRLERAVRVDPLNPQALGRCIERWRDQTPTAPALTPTSAPPCIIWGGSRKPCRVSSARWPWTRTWKCPAPSWQRCASTFSSRSVSGAKRNLTDPE